LEPLTSYSCLVEDSLQSNRYRRNIESSGRCLRRLEECVWRHSTTVMGLGGLDLHLNSTNPIGSTGLGKSLSQLKFYYLPRKGYELSIE
ncbi:hypothetical protein KCU89_g162, partial [Aureobasidium melanogenum]